MWPKGISNGILVDVVGNTKSNLAQNNSPEMGPKRDFNLFVSVNFSDFYARGHIIG